MPGRKDSATPPESAPRRPRRRAGQPFGPRWPGVGAGHRLVVVLAVGTVRVRQRDAVRAARSPGNPRERLPGVRARGLGDVLAVGRGGTGSGGDRDRAGIGIGPATTSGRFPDQARGGRGRRGPGPACVMPGQLNGIHPTSRRASPARRNPSALDPRDPTWRNASPGDITETTPPGTGLRHGVGDAAASGQADSPEAGLRRRCAGSRTASSTSPGRDAPRTTRPTRPLSAERIDMSIDPAAAEQEYDFFAQAANQVPQGPPRRRSRRLSAPVPVRFSPEVLQRVRERADADDRSVSSWIRRAVENELGRSA